jgi:protein disulfide-isomerase
VPRAPRWRPAAAWATVALTAATAACGPGEAPTPAAPGAASADAPAEAAIAWFRGDLDAAFATATATGKPVLLYWGAEWCPDCKQLKSSVFTRADFIARTRQFVAVYLDGDQPGAQALGDAFRVTGYPTLVVLAPDRREVTRVAGGMDLSLYAAALDAALADLRPMAEVVAAVARPDHALTADDCRRLAWHGYGLDDGDTYDPAVLAAALARAATGCAADRDLALRLRLLAAVRALAPADPATRGALTGLLADPAAAVGHIDVLAAIPREAYAAAPPAGSELATRVASVAAAAATDARFPPADQLYAERLRLVALAATRPDGRPPPDLLAAALARATGLLATTPPGYVRASLVTPTLYLYTEAGDWEGQRALLRQEVEAGRNVHYYLGDLARVEEQLGNATAALDLYAEAWRRAEGAATRAQWGYDYVAALLRLAPADAARVRTAGLELLADVGGGSAVHRRTAQRLGRLGTQLGAWATTAERQAVVRTLHDRLAAVCAGGTGEPPAGCAELIPAA